MPKSTIVITSHHEDGIAHTVGVCPITHKYLYKAISTTEQFSRVMQTMEDKYEVVARRITISHVHKVDVY